MHVAPFTHAHRREKILVQQLLKFAIRFLVLPRLFIKRPTIHERQELRLRVHEFLVCNGGFLLLVVGTHTRVLYGQGRRDHQHL